MPSGSRHCGSGADCWVARAGAVERTSPPGSTAAAVYRSPSCVAGRFVSQKQLRCTASPRVNEQGPRDLTQAGGDPRARVSEDDVFARSRWSRSAMHLARVRRRDALEREEGGFVKAGERVRVENQQSRSRRCPGFVCGVPTRRGIMGLKQLY